MSSSVENQTMKTENHQKMRVAITVNIRIQLYLTRCQISELEVMQIVCNAFKSINFVTYCCNT